MSHFIRLVGVSEPDLMLRFLEIGDEAVVNSGRKTSARVDDPRVVRDSDYRRIFGYRLAGSYIKWFIGRNIF